MKFIVTTIVILFVPAVVWYYLPEPVRQKTTGFIVDSSKRDSGEIANSFKETFLPKSPQEKRKEIIVELKKNFEALTVSTASLEPKYAEKVAEAIKGSELLIETLEKEVHPSPSLAQRALDLIFPPKAQECRVE